MFLKCIRSPSPTVSVEICIDDRGIYARVDVFSISFFSNIFHDEDEDDVYFHV